MNTWAELYQERHRNADRDYETARDTGRLLCSCPGERTDDECPTCHRPRLSDARIAYLRERA